MTPAGALLFVIGHFLAIWLLTVAIGFTAGWFARRRKAAPGPDVTKEVS